VKPLLEVREVTKHFGAHAVVEHVSFQVMPGEAVGLVGSNGAGKTTLFRLIAGELPMESGQVLFRGRRLPTRADARSRRGIGRTFQLVELFGGLSVLDHLLVALQAHEGRQGPVRDLIHGGETLPAERVRCQEALELCGLAGLADVPATTLSLGQRRAVELARALVTRPTLLLADEPSSGLDLEESAQLAAVIGRVREETGLAVLLIDHDLGTVDAVAERVIAMDAGQIIAEGTFDEVVRDERVITSWLGRLA
jgi:ABC-type branched-subunit amino acid transport system ATPase component